MIVRYDCERQETFAGVFAVVSDRKLSLDSIEILRERLLQTRVFTHRQLVREINVLSELFKVRTFR